MSSAWADSLLLARNDSSRESEQSQAQLRDSREDQQNDARYRQRFSAEEKRQLRLDIKDAGRKIYPSRRR